MIGMRPASSRLRAASNNSHNKKKKSIPKNIFKISTPRSTSKVGPAANILGFEQSDEEKPMEQSTRIEQEIVYKKDVRHPITQLDIHGEPILTRAINVPKLKPTDASKMPIYGLPLMNYEQKKLYGK